MKDFSKKQKILIGIIIATVIVIIGIYGYFSMNQEEVLELGDGKGLENIEGTTNEEVNNQKGNANVNVNKNENESGNGNENKEIDNDSNLDGKIIIHITGAVNKTGILVLPEGARIADAIEAAKGATKEADLEQVNLAYSLEDGQKLYIPQKKDKDKMQEKVYITSESGNNVIIENEKSAEQTKQKGGNKKVNLNTATQEQLEELPGIGPSTAIKIIEYRKQNGKFQKIEDLQNVKGIGEAKFSKVKDLITI